MKLLFHILSLLLFVSFGFGQVVKQQAALRGNDLSTFIWNTGIINQDLRTNNTPGLEWPINTGKFVCFSAGLTIAAYVNGSIRMACAAYNGEYGPGIIQNGQLINDQRFKFYKVTRGDNYNNNPDWLNWGHMVPFGAPFTDMNNNGTYEYFIDIPGYKNAAQTIFICLTDGDPSWHTPSEGFGGGTPPLFANVSLTAWCYDTLAFRKTQFFKWQVTNGGISAWDSVVISIIADTDLGDALDDYIGCDSVRNLAYTYNADNSDGTGSGITYGLNPPAYGMMLLNCAGGVSGMASFNYYMCSGCPGGIYCETGVTGPLQAYNYMLGLKNDRTPYVVPNTNPPLITKYNFSGNPETNTGWTEFTGKVNNCGGLLTGNLISPVLPGDRRMILSTRPAANRMNPGETHTVLMAQLVARGNNHTNSVTALKRDADSVRALCQNNFVIGLEAISSLIPSNYNLYQNYPNPFNPVTKIKFDIPKSESVTIKIYNALGKEITTLVNDIIKTGIYSIDWDGSAYPSGIYFCRIVTENFTQTNKMILMK
jgi:hypothetical protein